MCSVLQRFECSDAVCVVLLALRLNACACKANASKSHQQGFNGLHGECRAVGLNELSAAKNGVHTALCWRNQGHGCIKAGMGHGVFVYMAVFSFTHETRRAI